MEYKEIQLDSNAAKALALALGSTNAKMVEKKKQPAEKKKGAARKAENRK